MTATSRSSCVPPIRSCPTFFSRPIEHSSVKTFFCLFCNSSHNIVTICVRACMRACMRAWSAFQNYYVNDTWEAWVQPSILGNNDSSLCPRCTARWRFVVIVVLVRWLSFVGFFFYLFDIAGGVFCKQQPTRSFSTYRTSPPPPRTYVKELLRVITLAMHLFWATWACRPQEISVFFSNCLSFNTNELKCWIWSSFDWMCAFIKVVYCFVFRWLQQIWLFFFF